MVVDIDSMCVYYIGGVCKCLQAEDWQKSCPTKGDKPKGKKTHWD